MVGSFGRLVAAALFAGALAGCASSGSYDNYAGYGSAQPGGYSQCVPYARARSGIDIHGDAYTWWGQADGRYRRDRAPALGSVMVLYGYAGPDRAHLAVVSGMDSPRIIRVDHANWFNDGRVYTNDPVMDVSAGNDWSQVRIWNYRTGAWGGSVYPVQGFIDPVPDNGAMRVAGSY